MVISGLIGLFAALGAAAVVVVLEGLLAAAEALTLGSLTTGLDCLLLLLLLLLLLFGEEPDSTAEAKEAFTGVVDIL